LFIACAWPISIRRVVKNKSTKGKSLLFSCIVLLGYVFGIAHKFLFDLDYIVIVYFLNVTLVTVDTIVLLYTRHKYERKA
jgi:hypothetical protein